MARRMGTRDKIPHRNRMASAIRTTERYQLGQQHRRHKNQNSTTKMKEMGGGQTCMPETNLDWKIEKVREDFGYRTAPHWKDSRRTFASSKVRARGDKFLPGRAANLAVGKWTGYCLDSGQDSSGMGRWTLQKLRGKEGNIIN